MSVVYILPLGINFLPMEELFHVSLHICIHMSVFGNVDIELNTIMIRRY